MPTDRKRHAVTETDGVAAVLDEAARRWPGVERSKLIPLVLRDWASTSAVERRRTARRGLVGSLPGSSALYERSADWPT
ncbi:MAG: hypothetical protein ACLGHT_13170 [Acidimicrobiia bacterium]